jgi:flavin reductase (DIM6/NTAB) family NADH-FMN oxidoreductase RutF/DNA-binding GntR family transcriptional regulator
LFFHTDYYFRMSESADSVAVVDRAAFRETIGHFATGVAVITTVARGRRFGMTASAVASLSLDPPMLVACINRRAPTCVAVRERGTFAVNILTEDQGALAERFARPRRDKFAGVGVEEGATGAPLLVSALARIECRVAEQVTGGSHTVFLADVVGVDTAQGSPLTYFRGRFGRLDLAEDEAVTAELRRRVLRGDYRVGAPLDVDVLTAELHTEPWHVYHALTHLVADDLVTRDPEQGYVLAPVDLATIEDALQGRRAIEVGSAELAVGRTTRGELAELRRLMEGTEPFFDGGRLVDVHGYAAANAAFHAHLVGLARSDALLHAYRRLGLTGILARSLQPASGGGELLADHRDLVDAYERGDLALARRVIDRHTEHARAAHRRAFQLSAAASGNGVGG